MRVSRLERSSNALLTDLSALQQFCDARGVPYTTAFYDKVLPTWDMKLKFASGYPLRVLPATNLREKGSSTAIVFETKAYKNAKDDIVYDPQSSEADRTEPLKESFHGEVVATVCQQVGSGLQPGINTIYIQSSLNPNYRAHFEKNLVNPVKELIENQGVPVIITSIGWDDAHLSFRHGLEEQANHFWQVTAFVVDSAGNDGLYGADGERIYPEQKHNIITHAAPLVVHVGAASLNQKGRWEIDGYSSANSPTFLAPVAPQSAILWGQDHQPAGVIGTSVAGPYVGGALTALNRRYGAYLTREQILFAVIATCEPVTHVSAFGQKSPAPKDIAYTENAADLSYNPEYGGFGLINAVNADHVLGHMVALSQQQPKSITIPTEERVRLDINAGARYKVDGDQLHHYDIAMPAGYALKTTVEVEFKKAFGKIFVTSPSGTSFPIILSRQPTNNASFGIGTSHGWTGEELEGVWRVTSTKPVRRLRLNQHHFLPGDIVHDLNPKALLEQLWPDLSQAVPLREFNADHSISRILKSKEVRGLSVGGKPLATSDVDEMIAQLQSLPSGFAHRRRKSAFIGYTINPQDPAGNLELQANQAIGEAIERGKDADRMKAARLYSQAAILYAQKNQVAPQINNLSLAGQSYLNCSFLLDDRGNLLPEQAIPLLQQAISASAAKKYYAMAYRDNDFLYTALCRTCTYYADKDPEKMASYASLLPSVREQARLYSFQHQGGVDSQAHRIEEGEVGFSSHERIGTDNVSQCLALIVQDPVTLKTGVAHLDNLINVQSLDHFFGQIGENRVKIRLVGARFQNDVRSRQNIKAVMDYLRYIDGDVISAAIYGNDDGPSAVVVDPQTFTMEEKVPTYPNGNEGPSNAILFFAPDGKPLITQFDYTKAKDRAPIHMSSGALEEFREFYVGRKEWELERYLGSHAYSDRALVVHSALALENAYQKEWTTLSAKLEKVIITRPIAESDAAKAREALAKQSFYVGENAGDLNTIVYAWIEKDLFKNDKLQEDALKGVVLMHNSYESNHDVQDFLHPVPPNQKRQSIGQKYRQQL